MKSILCILIFASSLVFANDYGQRESVVEKFEIQKVPLASHEKINNLPLALNPGPGEIIAMGRELVALGEDIYRLVEKGRPSTKNVYAPINVLPKDPRTRTYVDPMDLEQTSRPIKEKYVMIGRNVFGGEVLRFEFMVIFQTGRYGKGRYIQNAVIVPTKVRALYSNSLDSEMKLVGISNSGSKASPIAGAILMVTYKASSMIATIEGSHVFDLQANGTIRAQ